MDHPKNLGLLLVVLRVVLVRLLTVVKLVALGLKLKRLPRVGLVQVAALLVVRLPAPLGPPLAALGHQLYVRLLPVETVAVLLHQFGHQGRALLRPRPRGYKHPHHPLPRPLAEHVRVEWVPRVLFHLARRRLLHVLLLAARPVRLSPPARHLLRPRLPGRVALVNLYR